MGPRAFLLHLAALVALGPARAGAAVAPPAAPAPPAVAFRIETVEPGVYRVTYADLVKAGATGPLAAAGLGLRNQGRPVPLYVRAGADGALGAGDWIEFVAETLPGENAHFNEYTSRNVYVLSAGEARPARMKVRLAPRPGARPAATVPLVVRQHLEQDLVLLRLAGGQGEKEELWHWAKLTQIDPEPFTQTLDLSDLDTTSTQPVRVRVELRGWSQPASKPTPETKDHRVEVTVGGEFHGAIEWDNAERERRLELSDIPAIKLTPGPLTIQVNVPPRVVQGQDALIDVSVLNWIEVDYPRVPRPPARQARVFGAGAGSLVIEDTPAASAPVVFGDDGSRWDGRSFARAGKNLWADVRAARRFDLVAAGAWLHPVAITKDRPSRLKTAAHQADYIMVTHPRLRAAIEPLAAFHRKRGLKVEVVDIQDVYDEFNHGILNPHALRDFLSYAYHEWKKPAPRWVLLVGDASWDSKNETAVEEHYPASAFQPAHGTLFSEVENTPYQKDPTLNHRNLIPTWSYLTYDGHAAGDNWFVSVDGDDELPDMAVGRITAVEPAEVTAVVDKTIRYTQDADYGPWRRRILWITSEQLGFQYMSNAVADTMSKAGYAPDKLYPAADSSSEADQLRLRDALDRGHLLVHFVGHGGRYIWRTGPADWQKHRDLFNLADIDLLKAETHLPMVVSMTCYSAPFDHPSADSIGEKFLRAPGKGAVAVLAASWRNAPYQAVSQDVIQELTRPGALTIGEAIQKVKRDGKHKEFIEQYNLLGDPALRLAVPRLRLDLTAGTGPNAAPQVSARLDSESFAGRAQVEWLDAQGEVMKSQEMRVDGPRFSAVMPGGGGAAKAVRVYAWDEAAGVDGLAEVTLDGGTPSAQGGQTP